MNLIKRHARKFNALVVVVGMIVLGIAFGPALASAHTASLTNTTTCEPIGRIYQWHAIFTAKNDLHFGPATISDTGTSLDGQTLGQGDSATLTLIEDIDVASVTVSGKLTWTNDHYSGPLGPSTAFRPENCPPDNNPKKVWVCKYVGQPGVDERLKSGKNPIEVSVNSIPDYQGVGSYFADGQDRSFVLAESDGVTDHNASECPNGDHSTPPSTVTTTVQVPGPTTTVIVHDTETETVTPAPVTETKTIAGPTTTVEVPVPGPTVTITETQTATETATATATETQTATETAPPVTVTAVATVTATETQTVTAAPVTVTQTVTAPAVVKTVVKGNTVTRTVTDTATKSSTVTITKYNCPPGTKVTGNGLAQTGGDNGVLAVIGTMLVCVGIGALWAGRQKGARTV